MPEHENNRYDDADQVLPPWKRMADHGAVEDDLAGAAAGARKSETSRPRLDIVHDQTPETQA